MDFLEYKGKNESLFCTPIGADIFFSSNAEKTVYVQHIVFLWLSKAREESHDWQASSRNTNTLHTQKLS